MLKTDNVWGLLSLRCSHDTIVMHLLWRHTCLRWRCEFRKEVGFCVIADYFVKCHVNDDYGAINICKRGAISLIL